MVRILVYLLFLVALALGLAWLIDHPGEIVLNWQGYRIKTSLLVGLGAILSVVTALVVAWNVLRSAVRSPAAMARASRARRREKGFAALSQGIHAVGVGDAQLAARAAARLQKYLPGEPVALLLRAEAAQLMGDHQAVEAIFREMTARDDTRLLGYRGLHAHAHRRGEIASAHNYASAAHDIAALPWSAAAVFDRRVAEKDWQGALDVLEDKRNFNGTGLGERQRAVLRTALALEKEQSAPDEALGLARLALKRAPDLVPAAALAARLLARKGAVWRAAKAIESAWPLGPHPDLAKFYLDLRPGESHNGRLARARALAKLAPGHPESRMMLASAAIAACDFRAARESMRPLIAGEERPTTRMCLLMAEIEEAEHGESGYIREWLARAARAPRDACWTADGVMSDQWMPASPVSGKLGAFVWKRPDERIAAGMEPADAIFRPIAASPEAPANLLPKKETMAIPPPEPEPARQKPASTAAAAGIQPVVEDALAAGSADEAAAGTNNLARGGAPFEPLARDKPEPSEGLQQPS